MLPVEGARWPVSGPGAYLAVRSPSHTHRGVDLKAPLGTLVRSVGAGVVTHAVEPGTRGFRGYGRAIAVRDDTGTHWLYAHLDRIAVRAGDRVKRGQAIGTVGDTCDVPGDSAARCRGPHLHLEASATKYPKDPEAPRLDPLPLIERLANMATPENAPKFRNLDGLIRQLLDTVPQAARTGQQWSDAMGLFGEWQRAFELSQTGWGLADSALAYWVDQYNTIRGQLEAAGLPNLPPKVKRDPTWTESVTEAASSVGRGVGALAALVVLLLVLKDR